MTWARVEGISKEQAHELGETFITRGLDNFVAIARASEPILGCWVDGALVAIVGFIPQGLLTGTAYYWMEWTPAVRQFPKTTARWGHYITREALGRYPRLWGTCSAGGQSRRWLERLGARFDGTVFKIGDWG
jgi:hypothetical protein